MGPNHLAAAAAAAPGSEARTGINQYMHGCAQGKGGCGGGCGWFESSSDYRDDDDDEEEGNEQ